MVTTAAITTATVFRANGDRYYFTLSGGNWVTDADVTGKLVQLPNAAGWRYTDADNIQEVYDASGRLISISEVDGHWQTLSYSTATTPATIASEPGLLMGVTDDTGRKLSFIYDVNARITQLTAGGQIYKYTYGTDNNLVSITYPDANAIATDNPVKTYLYTDTRFPNALTGIQDENLKQYATWTYNVTGRAVSSEHAGGVSKATLSYNADGSTTITDALNSNRTYNFTTVLGVQRLTSQDQPDGSGCLGAMSELTYDTNGNTVSHQDFNGYNTCSAYHTRRNLETIRVEGVMSCPVSLTNYNPAIGPLNSERKITTDWHPLYRLETRRAAPQKITTWVYNGQPDPSNNNATANCAPPTALLPDGNPIAVLCKKIEQATTDLSGAAGFAAVATGTPRIWSYAYNSTGQVLTADGPRTDVADVTTYAYYDTSTASYQAGDLQSLTNGVGHVTRFMEYDSNGQPLTIVNPNNIITSLNYTPRGWLETYTITPPAGSTLPVLSTKFAYFKTGLLNTVTLPNTSVLTYGYDAAHRLTSVKDSLGNSVTYTLDAMGNRNNEAYKDSASALKRNIDRVYDALNRLQTVTGDVQ